ncbi:DUF551 domain-containing protein [Franconibacter sp. IITDAS19]|uniref:DUF551 domain-containing protein n=1 Tax=Franconibacter sp. IITDAS19 TaxID=2930569 RepID=UPI001FFA6F00|nr:DUF551 domain-containing protein [Franconibacter sp. IITDAS19]MCK1966817.1 DUF551 domain-containing protein [Franconibacter sp. IITDAS19]
MSDREQFEAWFQPRQVAMKKNGIGLISINRLKQRQWEAWQASREALKAEQGEGGWIACADRMPNEGDLVTVCDHGIDVYPAVFSSGEFYEYSDRIIIEESTRMSNPTHWMPLPAPPAVNQPIDTTSQQYEALSNGESNASQS